MQIVSEAQRRAKENEPAVETTATSAQQ
jgi:hypothetical protein